MKKLNWSAVLIIVATLAVPFLIFGVITFIEYSEFSKKEPDYGRCMDYTVTEDGQYAWAAIYQWSSRETLELRRIDLASQTVVEEQTVPVKRDCDVILFTQDSAVYLVALTGEARADLVFHVYAIEEGKAPELLSDTLRPADGEPMPIQWQNRIIFTGEDAQGRVTMMYLESGELHTVGVEKDFQGLAGNIDRVSPTTNHNTVLPVTTLLLYDNSHFYVGPWLENSGLPVTGSATDDDEGPAPPALMAREFYSQGRMVELTSGENAADILVSFSAEDIWHASGSSPLGWNPEEDNTPVDAPDLFNAHLYYLDTDTVLVMATKAASPKSERMLYLYDRMDDTLQPLPSAISELATVETFTSRVLAWKNGNLLFVKGWLDTEGLIANLADGTAITTSRAALELIHPPSYGGPFKQFIASQGGIGMMLLMILPFLLPVAIIFIVLNVRSINEKRRKKAVAEGVHLEAVVLSADWTHIVIDEHYHQMKLELAFVYQGQEKTGTTKMLLAPGQIVRPGDVVYIAYNPQSGKINLLMESDEDHLERDAAVAAGPPQTPQLVFATVTNAQPTGYTYKSAAVLQLSLTLDDGRTVQIPALEAAIAPYAKGEVVELELPEGNPAYAGIASRSPNYKYSRQSIQGEQEKVDYVVTRVDDPGIILFGRKLFGLEIAIMQKNGTLVQHRVSFPPAGAVIPEGTELSGVMEKSHFDYRMALQNRQQGAAVVQDIQYTGFCFGSTPFCKTTLAIDGVAGTFTAEEGEDVSSVPQPGQRVWVGYDPQTRNATIIRLM